MEDATPVSTPMVSGCKLSKDDTSPEVDQRLYRSMIGSLLYITASRPDIMHAVGMVGRFQATPKQSHLLVVKRIFKYLKGTLSYGLWYPRNQNSQVITYSDADWANCVNERKSTSGGAFFLGESLVSWLSKKQSSISLSTTEAEYTVVATCCTQILWMVQCLAVFSLHPSHYLSPTIYIFTYLLPPLFVFYFLCTLYVSHSTSNSIFLYPLPPSTLSSLSLYIYTYISLIHSPTSLYLR